MKKNKITLFIAAYALLFSLPVAAQQTGTASSTVASSFATYQSFYYVIAGLLLVMFFMMLTMLKLAKLIGEQQYHIIHGKPMETASELAAQKTKEDWFTTAWKKLTASVPKGVEKDVMLDHNYDGIRELDNRMPPWLQYIFIVSVATAITYLFVFHVYHIGKLPLEEYAAELNQAETQKAMMLQTAGSSIDESTVKLLTDVSSIAAGKTIFIARCSPCHGQKGEGGVGPNLTDDYWLHGGAIGDVFKTVKYGIPAKGMVSWSGILKAEEMETVSSFIMSLHGTNPPNPKAPQGDKFVPQVIVASDTVAVVIDTTKVKS
ncbi:MAG: c-type cytochrome [Chitinophagaceae bacterium]|nr:c-type cytochrome [Chitinophagaceae bacterium]